MKLVPPIAAEIAKIPGSHRGWFIAAVVGAVALGALVAVILAGILAGCLSSKEIVPAPIPGIRLTQDVVPPTAPSGAQIGGPVWDYWKAPVTAVVRVYNDGPAPVRVDLDCGLYEPQADVPPGSHRSILVPTDMAHARAPLCTVLHEGPVPPGRP